MASDSKTETIKSDDKKYSVTVIGGGSYGTALATVVARKGYPVKLYVRDKEQCAHINEVHKNNKRLKSYEIPHNVKAVTDVDEACKGVDLIIHALPAQYTLSFLEMNKKKIPEDVPYVCTAKGIHLETKKLMSELVPEALGRKTNLAYLSGPSFAVEMMEKHPMSVVVASEDKMCAKFVQKVINSMWFRVYVTTDVIGVEVGGSLKNPLAIGAGIANGLGYGQSTLAGIVTRGAVEMQRLAMAMGGRPETLAGLSGMGDLMLTCFSSLSRNNRCGFYIGHDNLTVTQSCDKIGEVVEGVPTSQVILELMEKYKLRMPLFRAVGLIIKGDLSPKEALREIMATDPYEEGFQSSYDLMGNKDDQNN